MKNPWYYLKIPKSRIASFDVYSVGLNKHHISALLEFDVTDSRRKLRDLRKSGINISFNAWLIKVISSVLQHNPVASAFLYNKKKLIIFDDINISILIKKKIGNSRVPIPLVIEKTNVKDAHEIALEIENAKNQELTDKEVVLKKQTTLSESIYYKMPGFIRRQVWRIMLRNPRYVYKKMGNAVITSVGTVGMINGWFIQKSVHPISFGIGSVINKPVVIDNEIKIREILNMTILVDHDVIDGAPMVRFLNELTKSIESGSFTRMTNS